MLKRDGIIYRNLEEQVEENKKNIAHILEINNLLVGAGVKLIGHSEAEADLPNPQTYAGNYGDAYMVGTETPYNLYVFTRPLVGEQYPDWFNVGPFPAPSTVPGPQGVQGPQGEPGVDGATWTTGTTNPAVGNAKEGDLYLKSDGTVFKFTSGAWTRFTFLSGPQGPQGEQGPQGIPGPQGPQGAQGNIGDPGDTVKIVGTVASEDLLPTPTEEDRHNAYIIHNNTDNHDHLYIVIGDTDLSWHDTGAVGTELDINAFVTTNTEQNISGAKTFTGTTTINGYQVTETSSKADPRGKIIVCKSDGVMEIGQYIDFHLYGVSNDYSTRIMAISNSENTLILPTATGTFALTSDIPGRYLHTITYIEDGPETVCAIIKFITSSSTAITYLGQLGNDIYKCISISGYKGGSTIYELDIENEAFNIIAHPQYLYSKTLIVDDEVTTL